MSVIISGDVEVVNLLRRMQNEMFPRVILPFTKDYAEQLRDRMIKREHYRSGRLRASTKVSPIQNGWQCIVDVPYAEQENQRPGSKRGRFGGGQGTPHRFVEPSLQEQEKVGNSRLETLLAVFIASL